MRLVSKVAEVCSFVVHNEVGGGLDLGNVLLFASIGVNRIWTQSALQAHGFVI